MQLLNDYFDQTNVMHIVWKILNEKRTDKKICFQMQMQKEQRVKESERVEERESQQHCRVGGTEGYDLG